MSVQVRRNKDGSLASQFWYAVFEVKGRRHVVSTGIAIEGEPGSKAFLLSKGRAQTVQDQMVEEARKKSGAEKIVQRLVEIKTGDQYASPPLSSLADAWAAIPRKRKPGAFYLQCGRNVLDRFVHFLHDRHPGVKVLADVSANHARAFMDTEERRGITPRTWNQSKGLLRSAFRHLDPSADAYRNYFAKVPDKTEDSVHRQPFTPEEIAAILTTAANDQLMRPLIVTALCTAMRRGDCAMLKWADVDLKGGFITVKTSKTGETVEIPIMPLLRDELMAIKRGKNEYVFPEAAKLYQQSADGLNYRLKEILTAAGFVDAGSDGSAEPQEPALPSLPADELRARGLAALDAIRMTAPKRERAKAIFTAYLDGHTIPDIAASLKVGQGTASAHLNQLEQHLKAAVIRRKGAAPAAAIRGTLYSNGVGQRLKRGSLRGWHSFRTTFITLALSAGLPMELVRRITGHTTVDIVLKHYFRPGREDFRRALQSAMPKLLTNGSKSPKEEAIAILDGMTAKTWKQDAAKMRQLLTAI